MQHRSRAENPTETWQPRTNGEPAEKRKIYNPTKSRKTKIQKRAHRKMTGGDRGDGGIPEL